jgi:AcrR family transcriptional regulator
MTESASQPLRAARKRDTAAGLTEVSRRLTAEHGLAGFTIEQVCDAVGVSRRTFFNYFPSKEEAVLGIDEAAERERFAREFRALGSRGWPSVLDDLIDLVVQHAADMAVGRDEQAAFLAAIEREPRLLARVMGMTRDRERELVSLIAEREDVADDDHRARAAVEVLAAVLRLAAVDAVHAPDTDLDTAVRRALEAARTVLTTASARKDQA